MAAVRNVGFLLYAIRSLTYRKSNSVENTSNLVILATLKLKLLTTKKFMMANGGHVLFLHLQYIVKFVVNQVL